MGELQQRLVALSDELADPVRPVPAQAIRRLGRRRRHRRTAGTAALAAVALLAAVVVPGRAAAWFGAEPATTPALGRPTQGTGTGGTGELTPVFPPDRPTGGTMTFRMQGSVGWAPSELASEAVTCQLDEGWLVVSGMVQRGTRVFTLGVSPEAARGADPAPFGPSVEVPFGGLYPFRDTDGPAPEGLLVDGPRARVELDEPSGRAGTLTGPWRVADPDGRTVRGGNGLTATITWRCPPGPLAP